MILQNNPQSFSDFMLEKGTYALLIDKTNRQVRQVRQGIRVAESFCVSPVEKGTGDWGLGTGDTGKLAYRIQSNATSFLEMSFV
jgi:hypothetical protein